MFSFNICFNYILIIPENTIKIALRQSSLHPKYTRCVLERILNNNTSSIIVFILSGSVTGEEEKERRGTLRRFRGNPLTAVTLGKSSWGGAQGGGGGRRTWPPKKKQ